MHSALTEWLRQAHLTNGELLGILAAQGLLLVAAMWFMRPKARKTKTRPKGGQR